MDTIKTFYAALYNSPHYSFGWVVFACMAILPAIVSGNLVQHHLTRLAKNKASFAKEGKPLLFNAVILALCICIIAHAFYLYVIM